ncbi:MAG TPA: hypothetical protein VKE42_03355 [Candidatus Cybelea sp.]|nr:hypothetical protein [Candidatus Cybelea sp.]
MTASPDAHDGTITADAREVREFVETYVAQARSATAALNQPGVLQMLLVNPIGDSRGKVDSI